MTQPSSMRRALPIPMDCDPIAKCYRWLEYATFGRYLERARFHWISAIDDAQRVLILGDGDGRFLARYAAANSVGHIDVVELSAEMLRLSRRRLDKARIAEPERIRLIRGDVLATEQLRGPFDVVVTNFFLDCFDSAGQSYLIEKLTPELAKTARWLVTDFQVIESSNAAVFMLLLTGIMYGFFRITTGLQTRGLVDFSPRLREAGFHATRRREWLFCFWCSSLWQR